MLKRVMYRAVLAVLAAGVGSSAAHADMIDDFTTPTPAVRFELGGAVGSTYTNTSDLSGGITRLITVTQTANESGFDRATSGQFGAGIFAMSTDTGTAAFSGVRYSFAPRDLSAAGATLDLLVSTDLGISFTARVSDGTTTGTQVRSVTPSDGGLPFRLLLSSFGVNTDKITSVELLLNSDSRAAVDLTLDDVRFNVPVRPAAPPPPPAAIPAPPALALIAAAVPALGLVRRARRKADG